MKLSQVMCLCWVRKETACQCQHVLVYVFRHLLCLPHFHTVLWAYVDTGGRPANNCWLFLPFAWWNLHTVSPLFFALFLPYFHLVAPWNWFLPACLLPLWAMHKLERGKKREMEGPIFPSRRVSHSSLEGGFSCSPLLVFGQEQREYVGTNASGLVWLG